jgi:hypothetical protein
MSTTNNFPSWFNLILDQTNWNKTTTSLSINRCYNADCLTFKCYMFQSNTILNQNDIQMHRVCLKYDWTNSWVNYPHKNKEKSEHQYMSANSVWGTAQQHGNLNPLVFYQWGCLKTLVYSGLIENEETLHLHIFMPVKLFTTSPSLWKAATVHDQSHPSVQLISGWHFGHWVWTLTW